MINENYKGSLIRLINTRGKVYLASPWFTDEQMDRCEWVRDTLKSLGFEVFSPKDESLCSPNSTEDFRQKTYDGNLRAIRNASFVLSITNGKDMGTLMESGHASALNIPIIYFAEGLNGPFNLMLAQSGIHVITSREQFVADLGDINILEHILTNKKVRDYNGEIE